MGKVIGSSSVTTVSGVDNCSPTLADVRWKVDRGGASEISVMLSSRLM